MNGKSTDWSAFYTQLHGFVVARVQVTSDADDLVQLILERAMTKGEGAQLENAAGWLSGIAKNAIADHYRGKARTLFAAADALDASADVAPPSDEERAEVLACMQPLLDTLSADIAQLLRWADMEGRPLKDIADELGITLTATKSRVQRARKELVRVTRECCAITIDARGRVTDLTPRDTPRAQQCASCLPGAGKPEGSLS